MHKAMLNMNECDLCEDKRCDEFVGSVNVRMSYTAGEMEIVHEDIADCPIREVLLKEAGKQVV